MEWEKILAKHISDKGLIFKIHKELTKLRINKKSEKCKNNPIKKCQRNIIDIFPK